MVEDRKIVNSIVRADSWSIPNLIKLSQFISLEENATCYQAF